MPELRLRKARQSYTALLGDEEEEIGNGDEQEPGPSQPRHDSRDIDRDKDATVNDDDCTSDFAHPAPEDALALSDEIGDEHDIEDPTFIAYGVCAGASSISEANNY
jgi:hypothetical protein